MLSHAIETHSVLRFPFLLLSFDLDFNRFDLYSHTKTIYSVYFFIYFCDSLAIASITVLPTQLDLYVIDYGK